MDQSKDFRVGNAFFVDQENSTVSFVGGSQSGGTTFDQLVVTGTGDTTILPTTFLLAPKLSKYFRISFGWYWIPWSKVQVIKNCIADEPAIPSLELLMM